MQTPIPTPYDIVPPLGGPLVPAPTAWLALMILSGAAFYYLYLRHRRPQTHPVKQMLLSFCSDLQMAISSADFPDLDRVSRMARRIVSQFITEDLTGLSAVETRRLADKLQEKTDDTAQSMARILSLISIIEEQAYAPLKDQHRSELRQALADLSSKLENHVRRYEPL